MIGRRALAAVGIGLVAGACAADAEPAASSVGTVRQGIVGGAASDETQDATVMLFHLDPTGPRRLGICTAALIAPRLVLTARHCVAQTDAQVACDSDGTPLLGARVLANHDPADLFVFTGKDRPAFIGDAPPSLDTSKWTPAGQGLEILDDHSGTLCNHDLALVLLREPVDGVPLAPLRLDGEASAGEKLLTVGWGVSFGEVEPATRQQRKDVTVERVGPSDAIPVLTKSEFLFDESICLGDSGGPVFAQATGAILGVVSRGGNGLDPNKGGPSSTCGDADNVATKLAPFKELVMNGFERAGAEPLLEPEPDEGCSAGAAGRGSRRGLFLVLGAVAALAARRRRRSIV